MEFRIGCEDVFYAGQRLADGYRAAWRFFLRLLIVAGLASLACPALSQSQGLPCIAIAPEELSNAFVRCFYKDSEGYLWLGTADGLMRYDGTNVVRYDHDPGQRNSLCHNYINAITEDSRHRLWIATAQGVCRYDSEKDNFQTLDSIHGLKNQMSNRYATALAFDGGGNLWVGTHEGGVNVFDPVRREFTYLVDANNGETSGFNYINTLLYVDGQMWCGSKGGLRIFDTDTKRAVPVNFGGDELELKQVSQLVSDNAGNVWVATLNGAVLKIIPKNGYYSFQQTIRPSESSGSRGASLLTLCRDLQGGLWFGGEHSGLSHLDTRTGTLTRYRGDEHTPEMLASNSIRAVYVDDAGLTWIGTHDKGAYRIDNGARKFERHRSYDGVSNNFAGRHVRGFAEDRKGNIWIAIEDVGLAKIDAKTGVLKEADVINKQLANRYLSSIIVDRRGDLWVGSIGAGVYKVDITTTEVTRYALHSAGFGNDKVYCLYEDRAGTVWAGTSGSGLFYFNPDTERFTVLCESPKANHIKQTAYISSMEEDADGVFWVATMYGLYALTDAGNHTFGYTVHLPEERAGSMSSGGIQAVYADKSKNLWVGTTDGGLNKKRSGTSVFDVFRKKDGLASNTVRALTEDAAGNVWIAGNMGLSMYNLKTATFAVYTREDGLPSNDFYNNACLRSSTGELFFGSTNGFTVFYPDSITDSRVTPFIYLSDFKVNNKSVGVDTMGSPLKKPIRLTTALELSYEQRSFVIEFASLNLDGTLKANYCYKLEGFDAEWNCNITENKATYTNLDPGTYVFLVKPSPEDGTLGNAPVRLQIVIKPLVWKTWWAMVLYCCFFVLIVYLLMKGRSERLAVKHQLAMERLAREQEHELMESKTQFFTNISHEFRTPLSLILMPLESLMAEEQVPSPAKDRIASAYRSADRMMHLVNELMDFSKMENGNLKLDLHYGDIVHCVRHVASAFEDLAVKRRIRFSIKDEVRSLAGWFDYGKLEKMLVNVVSNAFKFTADGGEVTIIIGQRMQPVGVLQIMSRCLDLAVIDNGIGIGEDEIAKIFDKFYQARSASKVPNPGTGIGLSWTRSLAELHQGFIEASSVPDKETRFSMVIPIDAAVFGIEASTEKAVDEVWPASLGESHGNVSGNRKVVVKDRADVLVVEDNDELREYLVRELRVSFNVIEAGDGAQGYEIAAREIPDLIISDILMPHKTGMEFCQAIKSDVKTSHIPFILLTAKATLAEQISGIEMGADVYVTKPFSIRYLLAHVRHLVDSRRQLYARFSQDVYLLPENCASAKLDQVFLERVVSHILKNLQDSQLSVDSLAEELNLSRVQLYRKIKALTGKTAVEFIRSVRLKHTLKLMETKQYTLSEIAYLSGFNSASYFTRAFKDEYGKAPSEYTGISD